MNKLILTLCTTAVVLALAPAAWADTFDYAFGSSDGSVTLNLEFTADYLSGDTTIGEQYLISNITGSFADSNNGLGDQNSPEALTSFDSGGPSITPTGDGLFTYDNLLNPDGIAFGGSFLDNNGVVFNISDNNGTEISFYGATNGDYWVYESPDGVNVNNPSLVELTANNSPIPLPIPPIPTVPEPSSFLLLGAGLLASIGLAGRRCLVKA